MADFPRKKKPEPNEVGDKGPRKPPIQITNPQCKVCNSPHRREIERLMVSGIGNPRICVFMEAAGETFNRQNLDRHKANHMSIEEAVIAEMWAHHARNALLDPDEMEGLIVTREGMLDVMLQYAKQAMERGEIMWSAQDILKVMDKQRELEAAKSTTKIDAMLREADAFGAAVRTVCPPDMWNQIYQQYLRNMEIQEAVPEIMAGEGDVTDADA